MACFRIFWNSYLPQYVIYVSMSTEGGGEKTVTFSWIASMSYFENYSRLWDAARIRSPCSGLAVLELSNPNARMAHVATSQWAWLRRGDYVMSASAPMVEGGEVDWKQSAHGSPCEHALDTRHCPHRKDGRTPDFSVLTYFPKHENTVFHENTWCPIYGFFRANIQ